MSKEESGGGQNGGGGGGQNGGGTPTKDNSAIYENKGPKKIIRIFTVLAYMFSVSFVGIVLSAYYLFLWDPPNPRLLHNTQYRKDPQVQFLMSDSPIFHKNKAHLEELLVNDFFKEATPSAKNFNEPRKRIKGRIADGEADGPRGGPYYRDDFSESLSLVKNSIVDALREWDARSKLNESSLDDNVKDSLSNDTGEEMNLLIDANDIPGNESEHWTSVSIVNRTARVFDDKKLLVNSSTLPESNANDNDVSKNDGFLADVPGFDSSSRIIMGDERAMNKSDDHIFLKKAPGEDEKIVDRTSGDTTKNSSGAFDSPLSSNELPLSNDKTAFNVLRRTKKEKDDVSNSVIPSNNDKTAFHELRRTKKKKNDASNSVIPSIVLADSSHRRSQVPPLVLSLIDSSPRKLTVEKVENTVTDCPHRKETHLSSENPAEIDGDNDQRSALPLPESRRADFRVPTRPNESFSGQLHITANSVDILRSNNDDVCRSSDEGATS